MIFSKPECPCGRGIKYEECCAPVIEGKLEAKTAEDLLRARYTAFAKHKIDFVEKTHHSETRSQVDRKEIESWSKNSVWEGLEILKSDKGQATDDEGQIAFHAQYRMNGQMQDHYEVSQFKKEGGKWKFFDAQGLKPMPLRRESPKTGRNEPCPCGSGKKYKKCHEATEAASGHPAK